MCAFRSRAHLCGTDLSTGMSFDHRKGWLVDLLGQLTGIFAVDLCAYSILSNHYHLVVRLDGARARSWSSEEEENSETPNFPTTVTILGFRPTVGVFVLSWPAIFVDRRRRVD